MVTWSGFYATVATAAATILGLLFVAVQFNLQELRADRTQRWLATARSTWIVLATIFFVSLLFIIPVVGAQGRVLGTAIFVFISGRRIVSAWLPVREGVVSRDPAAVKHALWVIIGPLVLFALLLGYTFALAHGVHSQVGIAYILIGLFALALRNSWDLLVELRLTPPAEAGSSDTEQS